MPRRLTRGLSSPKFQSSRGRRGCESIRMERGNQPATFALPRRRTRSSLRTSCVVRAVTRHTRPSGSQSSGEKRRVTSCNVGSGQLVATRGRPDATTADGRLTVKASSPAAAGHGVRPSESRHARKLRKTVLHHLAWRNRDRLGPPRSPLQRAICWWMLSVAQCTVGPALRGLRADTAEARSPGSVAAAQSGRLKRTEPRGLVAPRLAARVPQAPSWLQAPPGKGASRLGVERILAQKCGDVGLPKGPLPGRAYSQCDPAG